MEKARVDRRRRHSDELKARVLAACDEPGASVAGVALAFSLNQNLVHKWRRKVLSTTESVTAPEPVAPRNDFVPVPIVSDRDIRVIVRGRATTVEVYWPTSAAETCAQWMQVLLR